MRIADGLLISVLMSAALCLPAYAQVDACPLVKSDAADVAVGNIKSWHDFAIYRRQYAACDDGGTAESSSAAVVHLLATKWNTLPELQHETTADPALAPFFYRHINATVDGAELEPIRKQAATRCPRGAAALCRGIGSAASRALADLR